MVFICKLSQSRLQVGQFKWSVPDLAHVKVIDHFSRELIRSWMLESHSLMLASWQKAISSITFYAV